jgi:hypothetical protein
MAGYDAIAILVNAGTARSARRLGSPRQRVQQDIKISQNCGAGAFYR